jgi:hypothetical protein
VSATVEIVLGTVNAPYARRVSAQELAMGLRDEAAARAMPGHMSSFLGEVAPALQERFADEFGISKAQLTAAARAFAAYSGGTYPFAA